MVMFGNGNVWSEWKEEFLNSRITGINHFSQNTAHKTVVLASLFT